MAKLLPNQLAICLFACLLTGGLLMQTGCVGALSQLIYTIRGHDEEPAFPGLNDKRVAVVCVSDASAYGPDTLTYTVAQAVGIQLANGLDDGSQIVAPSKIEEWIDDNGWNETEYVELGRGVEADMVVAVKYLRDTHKTEAILLSLTPLVFERFLPSLTLWLSPNCPKDCAVSN